MRPEFHTLQNRPRQPQQPSTRSARLWLIMIYIAMLLLPLSSLRNSSVALAATSRAGDSSSSYADTVIIMDNINEIKSHDPTGVRFSAAQLFADMAPRGDSIGVVRIPSSSMRSPVQLLGLHTIQTNSDRNLVKSKLSQSQAIFQTVDPGPTAYFVPALQRARTMLKSAQDNNRKYVILVTDSAARTGDLDNCPESSDQFHRWFCTARQLESEGISVILFGFTTPGPQAQKELQPTKNYIEQQGGIVLQVDDKAGMPQVAEQYATLMSRIHPNVFETLLGGKTASVNVDAQDRLTMLTFVALGGANTSLSQVQQPRGDNVAGKNSDDGGYYHSSGAGYWLQTIANGNLVGPWQLGTGTSPPTEILALGVSEARFDLLNPAPTHGGDISQRFVVPGERVVLRARATGVDGSPIAGVSFVANPNSDNQTFTTSTIPMSAIPDNNTADISAILGVAPATNQINTLQVGLGRPLAGTIYLEKQFQIASNNMLANKWVQMIIPPTKLLKAGDSIPISGKGTTSIKPQSLAIFGRDASVAGWTQINTSSSGDGTDVSGSFPLQRGCGNTYIFEAVEEISGMVGDGAYDYLAFDQTPYISQLQESITTIATLNSDKTLSIWAPWSPSNQVLWNVTFMSTICAPRDMSLRVVLQPDQFSSHIQLNNGGGTFTVAENRSTTRQVTATIGSCPFNSLWQDRTDTVRLERQMNVSQSTEFNQAGDWESKVTCPSFGTYARGHIVQAILILFLLSVVVVRLLQLPILPLLPRKHLSGSASVVSNATALTGEDPPDIHTYAPVNVHVPSGMNFLPEWFLARRLEGADTMYGFEEHESPLALLHFKIEHDGNGNQVKMKATRYATGPDLPEFLLTHTPIGQDFVRCDKGESIIINRDIIYLNLNVVT
jgi:hypothetical protein